jgi:hypothetical protein
VISIGQEDRKKDCDAFETPAVQMTTLKDHEATAEKVGHDLIIAESMPIRCYNTVNAVYGVFRVSCQDHKCI